MYSFEELAHIIEKDIKNIALNDDPNLLYDPIRYSLSIGGKRVRPVLLLMAANLFNDDVNKYSSTALAVEVFHNFTLLHDDIMDNSSYRRGNPTVHKKWSENIAILSGDTMLITAYSLLSKCEPSIFGELMSVFNKFAIEICEGQQYDMDFENMERVTVSEYLNMIRLKTAVLVGGALKMGAIAAGADNKAKEQLYEFGINLGLAFQLQDDYLDTFGNEKSFGKIPGGDIAEGKKTFLLITTLDKADKDDKRIINEMIESDTISREHKFSVIKNMYIKYNADSDTLKEIEIYFEKALKILNDIDVENSRKMPLVDLAYKLMNRDK